MPVLKQAPRKKAMNRTAQEENKHGYQYWHPVGIFPLIELMTICYFGSFYPKTAACLWTTGGFSAMMFANFSA